jgi:hypothetical protein
LDHRNAQSSWVVADFPMIQFNNRNIPGHPWLLDKGTWGIVLEHKGLSWQCLEHGTVYVPCVGPTEKRALVFWNDLDCVFNSRGVGILIQGWHFMDKVTIDLDERYLGRITSL